MWWSGMLCRSVFALSTDLEYGKRVTQARGKALPLKVWHVPRIETDDN
jgi:hypothetical protein